jgi:hypothetical protein
MFPLTRKIIWILMGKKVELMNSTGGYLDIAILPPFAYDVLLPPTPT